MTFEIGLKKKTIESYTNPFNSKLLYLIVFSLEKLLHIFENSTCSIQVP